MTKEKKKRIANNEKNRLVNLKEAYGDRLPGTLDLQSAVKFTKALSKPDARMLVGKRAMKQSLKHTNLKYGHLNTVLDIAQHSTGSMGKFDALNRFEPKPKLKRNAKKDTAYLGAHDQNHKKKFGKDKANRSMLQKETEKQKEIMYQIFGKQQHDAFDVGKATKKEHKRIIANTNISTSSFFFFLDKICMFILIDSLFFALLTSHLLLKVIHLCYCLFLMFVIKLFYFSSYYFHQR
ncbi:hypothetical protein RFI_03400 [Reticulomyxa filosa]|uniref:Uncharacterized protein n=1 Tax=Reticulomyxa filosa TaxID=46433 RepID=X6P7U0_RETFI|nr:hypothetical protein RFI_03400 [Reticulomyxa filosa]|eukprot:ETO33702.1 hypothetical protein RFI_03400 [Reticulomyxa filosa]